jgi:activator of HSP90 ATPase
MPLERIRVSDVLPGKPEDLYAAWLDGKLHAKMTGSPATGEAKVGAELTAWDGYIVGRVLALEPNVRIVQTWRTTGFKDEDNDSRLEIVFEADPEGTKITLIHSDLPEGTGGEYEQGWSDHYIEPMRAYFRG